jgi:3-oxoacyl-[acyl-carrier-protein] synthase-3
MNAVIKAVEYHLPKKIQTNDELAALYPAWNVRRTAEKTGIHARHIAAENELASDLAVVAARKLFHSGIITPAEIDFILLCTQSPDYLLPTTACLLQSRLGIPTTAGALDFNLGCSGFVYGLSLAKGLIETGQAQNLLLITAETYTKHIRPDDRTVRLLFSDAAAVTLIQANYSSEASIGPFVFGTDGTGGPNLIVRRNGFRSAESPGVPLDLYMNGPEIFAFTLNTVPKSVHQLLEKAGKSLTEIDLFIFHQANGYMLEHLRDRLEIPPEKFFVEVSEIGNTVSASIPIAIKLALQAGRLHSGQLVMLVGFGVGYSWSGTLVQIP